MSDGKIKHPIHHSHFSVPHFPVARTVNYSQPSSQPVPLCVDLDGSLIKTNTLQEALVAALLSKPWLLCVLPFWLMRGQAYLWQRLSERVMINAATLPYRPETI